MRPPAHSVTFRVGALSRARQPLPFRVGALSRARQPLPFRVGALSRARQPLPSRAGFTFAELMTSVTIIAILGAILFPVFTRAREKARQSSCALNLHNIGMAMRVYATESFGQLPPKDNDLWALVPKYLPEPKSLLCLSAGPDQASHSDTPPQRNYPPGKPCDYSYKAGYCDDEKPDTVFVSDDVDDRHNGGSNYLFLDGHCKWLRTERNNSPSDKELAPGLMDLHKLGFSAPLAPPTSSQPPMGGPPGGGGGGSEE